MQTSLKHPQPPCAELRDQKNGAAKIFLRGTLDAQTTGACWRELEAQLRERRIKSLEVDVSEAHFRGSIGIALVSHLQSGGMTPGVKPVVRGLKKEFQPILEMFSTGKLPARTITTKWWRHIPEEVGAWIKSLLRDGKGQITFVGGVIAAAPIAFVKPRRMRWREVRRVIEKAGADALPVISIFSWLIGFVLALEAAHPLRNLGAEIFIADIIGFSALRDAGPLVTAIMLAGRSGSAFAAELGTMKVNEELDALTTMGLDPIHFLVLQRIVAAVLLTPLLALYSMLMSIVGGVTVMRTLGFPPLMIYHQIVARVGFGDLMLGLEKALIFGLIIGAIGCLRGLQTGDGPRAVGVSTTRSVVAGIMLVIIANSLFSVVQYVLKQ